MTGMDLTPKKHGGQTKISPDRLALFVGYVANGMPKGSAARAIGVHENTTMAWARRGRVELTRLLDAGTDPATVFDPTTEGWPTVTDWRTCPPAIDADEWPFVVFAVAAEKAVSSFESRMLAVIQKASTSSWQAAAWLLERRNPDEYSRPEARLRVAHEGPHGGPVQVESTVISVDDLEAKLAELDV